MTGWPVSLFQFNNNGSLVFFRGDAITVANTISGTGGLTQSGSGTLTLSGPNKFTGPVYVNGGTLAVNSVTWLERSRILAPGRCSQSLRR